MNLTAFVSATLGFTVLWLGVGIAREFRPALKAALAKMCLFAAAILTITATQKMFGAPDTSLSDAGRYFGYMLIGWMLFSGLRRSRA